MDTSSDVLLVDDDFNSVNGEDVDGTLKQNKISSGLKKMPFYQNLRHQLSEQLKSLESRLDAQLLITNELQEYFRKRSEIEAEFSKMLEKMYKGCLNNKRKDSSWTPSMLNNLMLNMLNETKKESKERLVLSEICGLIVNRLGLVSEDLNRIFKQCQSVCLEGQEELIKVLQELYLSSKSFQSQALEWKQTEAKLRTAEGQKSKAEVGLSREKIEKSKKIKALEKEVQKRLRKANDAKFKALKAKNEYIFCLDAANAAVQKYFVEDLSDLIDCMDLGMLVFSTSVSTRSPEVTWPRPEDTGPELETPPLLQEELEQRMYLLERRLCTLKIESNELWKTLETAESSLLNLIDENWNCNLVREWFAVGSISNALLSDGKEGSFKNRSDRIETDQYHINKYRDWMLSSSRVARLNSKLEHIKTCLGVKRASTLSSEEESSSERLKRRKRIGQRISSSCKLFGGNIEEYLEVNKVQIPMIIKSCVRVVNLFGLHHQGIFRVSGSQVEINNFRDSFERGEDPLCELTDSASDINSVASLLKLYLRELREPLFPIVFFDFFMEVAQLDNVDVFTQRMRELVTRSLPRPVFVVLRYLFHFLNHLSEYSEENMMDSYNLAICFGPTMVPVPADKDQVQFQNLVNELIKNVIIHAHDIFMNDGSGEMYHKLSDEMGVSSCVDEDSSQGKSGISLPTKTKALSTASNSSLELPATAQYDFKARSERELSFKKGQNLRLVSRVSNDWWKGVIIDGDDVLGLIPHKYIVIAGEKEEQSEAKEEQPTTSKTMQKEEASTSSTRLSLDFKYTPDLVLDLPSQDEELSKNQDSSSSSDESEPTTIVADNVMAEVFAKQNQCTLKKLNVKPKVMAKPKLPKVSVEETKESDLWEEGNDEDEEHEKTDE